MMLIRSLNPCVIILLAVICCAWPARALADDGRVLVITHARDYAPMAFIDRDGKPAGYLVDIWKMWAARNGIAIRFMLTDWKDTIGLVETGRADIHGGLFISPEREERIDFILPLTEIDGIVYGVQDVTSRHLGELGDLQVGIMEGDYSESYLAKKYPFVKRKVFANNMDLFDALMQGRIRVLVSDEPQMIFYRFRNNIPGSIRPIETLYTRSLYAGVRKGDRETAELVRAGFRKISREDMRSAYETWLPYRDRDSWNRVIRISGGIIAVVMLLIMAGNYYYLRRQVREKTAALQEELSIRRLIEKQLLEMATHDGLTGLPNRKLFSERVSHAIASARRSRTHVAVLFLDLDGFKTVNDTLGHDAGDELLRVVASRLNECVRESDTVARQGGDEFTILLESVRDRDEVRVVAGRIVESIAESCRIREDSVTVTVSMGISLYPDDGLDYHELVRRADDAMYRVKAEGKNGYRFHESAGDRSTG